MLVTLLGIVIEVRLEQPEKASLLILVTLLGIVIEVRLEQPEKAALLILVTLLGIVTEVRLEQPSYFQPIVYQYVQIKTVEK